MKGLRTFFPFRSGSVGSEATATASYGRVEAGIKPMASASFSARGTPATSFVRRMGNYVPGNRTYFTSRPAASSSS